MAKRNYWKVWLKRNPLTKEIENDFTAEVSTIGHTLKNEDVAAAIVEARSELRYETILGVLNERDQIIREALAQGSAVQDGCVRMSPRVSGTWTGASHVFDPTAHKLGLDVSPSVEMRATLETVGVEVLGEKNSGAYIGLVTDIITGKTDGTITPDEDIVVIGDKMKIAPEDDADMGVFFVDESGDEYPVTHKLSENTPKKLLFRVPTLAAGSYTLKIVTRFSNGSTLLNDPRIITYEFPLVVPHPVTEQPTE